mgnify:CR=1 FL=1
MVWPTYSCWSWKDKSNLNVADRYSIHIHGECKFSDLSEFEYFDIMEDLAIEFYQTGKPNPSDVHTEIIGD